MTEQKLKFTVKPCGDCWLDINAPSGRKASINLGQCGSINDGSFFGSVIREVAESGEVSDYATLLAETERMFLSHGKLLGFVKWVADQHFANGLSKAMIITKAKATLAGEGK